MYLSERLANSNQEQVAYLVTLSHNEFVEQVELNLIPETETLDSWLPFIGWCAVQMSVPRQRLASA